AAIAIGVTLYRNWDEIVAKVRDLWGRFSAWFSDMWDGIGARVREWFSGLIASAREWGGDLIAGLWQGIQEAWERLKASISNFFSGIADAARRALGISSPSKLFAEIGEDIMRGLQLGMEQMAPAVSATAVGATLPAAGAGPVLPAL